MTTRRLVRPCSCTNWAAISRTGRAAFSIAQTFEFGIDRLLASGELVQILADWAEERFPLFVYHPSRHLPSAKVRAFLDFVVASIPPTSKKRPVPT
jgi:DNA-binding transcriptional LysR family regulator